MIITKFIVIDDCEKEKSLRNQLTILSKFKMYSPSDYCDYLLGYCNGGILSGIGTGFLKQTKCVYAFYH